MLNEIEPPRVRKEFPESWIWETFNSTRLQELELETNENYCVHW